MSGMITTRAAHRTSVLSRRAMPITTAREMPTGALGIPRVPTSPMSPGKPAQQGLPGVEGEGDEHLRQFRNTAWAPPRTVCATAARQIVTDLGVLLPGGHQSNARARTPPIVQVC